MSVTSAACSRSIRSAAWAGAVTWALAFSPPCGEWLPSACKMARAASLGRIWSSRTYRFFGLPGLERAALV